MKIKKLLSCIAVLGIVCITYMPVSAQSNKTILLPKNQVWTQSYSENRTGNYSYVQVGCDSVYPLNGDALSSIDIKEGYLKTTKVRFQFRGNSKEAANAVVDYYGK